MLPSNMELKNKIIVSDGKFILGKNEKVDSLEVPAMKSHKGSNHVKQTAVTHKDSETAVTHKDLEKSQLLPMKKRKLL